MYCRKCKYPLKKLPEPRCPECGTEFDPDDPGGVRASKPPLTWLYWIVGLLLLLAIAAVGTYYHLRWPAYAIIAVTAAFVLWPILRSLD